MDAMQQNLLEVREALSQGQQAVLLFRFGSMHCGDVTVTLTPNRVLSEGRMEWQQCDCSPDTVPEIGYGIGKCIRSLYATQGQVEYDTRFCPKRLS